MFNRLGIGGILCIVYCLYVYVLCIVTFVLIARFFSGIEGQPILLYFHRYPRCSILYLYWVYCILSEG